MTMRPIDADALKEIIKERRTNIEKKHGIEVGFAIGMLIACETIIDKQPAIEAKPVVRAHWKLDSPIDSLYCSNCGKEALRDYFEDEVRSNYCPHCGAQMDKVPKIMEEMEK